MYKIELADTSGLKKYKDKKKWMPSYTHLSTETRRLRLNQAENEEMTTLTSSQLRILYTAKSGFSLLRILQFGLQR
jgi:hypothetical protein